MPLVLEELASDECRFELNLRGTVVPVRWVPSKVQRIIERQIRDRTKVHGEPEQIEKHKASDAYKAKLEKIEYLRQCLRAAYACDMEVKGIRWSEEMKPEDAVTMAEGVSEMLTDAEIGEIYNASYASLKRRHDPVEQIGTGAAEGN